MSVSGVGSASNPIIPAAQATTSVLRAADGDYKTRNSHTAQTKDADGDYKSLNTSSSAATVSSGGVQAALSALKMGG